MNISKKFIFLIFLLFSSILISCSKDLHFSGISENSVNEILENYQNNNYSKEDVINIIGSPLVTEDSIIFGFIVWRKNKVTLPLKNQSTTRP